MLEELFASGAAFVPLVVALVEGLKQAGLPARWAPLASLVFGIVAGFVYVVPGDPRLATLAGLMIGLAASGLYSGTRGIKGGQPARQ